MLNIGDYFRRIRLYRVRTGTKALANIEREIASLPREQDREEATLRLTELRGRLDNLDLTGFPWPPQSNNPNEDTIFAETQHLVSAVLQVLHAEREVRILKFTLKARA